MNVLMYFKLFFNILLLQPGCEIYHFGHYMIIK